MGDPLRPIEQRYLDLIEAFHLAMKLSRDDLEIAHIFEDRAFDLAVAYGWDWEKDEDWQHWALKATHPEIIASGLATAIQKCKAPERKEVPC